MNEVKRTVTATLGVAAAICMVIAGVQMRNRTDLGAPEQFTLLAGRGSQLVASTDNRQIPAPDYFDDLADKLKTEYVEPITDEEKLASGAVRGMVSSLGDPQSLFMSKDQFQAFLKARQGDFEGIGATFALVMPASKKGSSATDPQDAEEAVSFAPDLPKLVVTDVVPSGPADRAGVKPGDAVYSVDGHWLINSSELAAFRALQSAYVAKKASLEQLTARRDELKVKTAHPMMPAKALIHLSTGTTGPVTVEWDRKGEKLTTKLEKADTIGPSFGVHEGVIVLPFRGGSVDELKKAIEQKQDVTIDLRHNVLGDFETMRECLGLLAPGGQYGVIANDRKESNTMPFAISKGNLNPPKIKLLVDQTTQGPARVFALALSSKGLATLSGEQMGGNGAVDEIVKLPDGSGYTLVTGMYKPHAADTVVARGGAR